MSKARKINTVGKQVVCYDKAIIYCRVSSDRQRTEGHGLESQEQRCRDYASQKGYSVPVDAVFKDSFTGGGDFHNRPALSALFSYVDSHPELTFVVLIDDLSRFARDVNAHFLLKKELFERGVGLECTNFNFEDTPEGELIETLMAAQHQYHRKNNRRQVIQKQKARLEMGYWAFGSKRGYKMQKNPIHGNLLTPIKQDAALIKEAFEGYASGRFTYKVEVCEFLVSAGFWKKQKPERYIDKLTLMMRDPLYAGYIEYLMWGVTRRKGHHEGIISLETHIAVQRRLDQESRNKRPRVDVSDTFPLRGLVKCECCGKPLTGAVSGGRSSKYPYYRCQNKECQYGTTSIPISDIHNGFEKLLLSQNLKPEVEKLVQVIFDRAWDSEVQSIKLFEAKADSKIAELKEKIKELTEIAIKAKSDRIREVYEQQIEEYAAEIESLEITSIKGLDLDIPYRTALGKATGLLKSPYKIWHSVDGRERQKLFYFIFEEKLPYSKKAGYRTDNLPCAVRLFEDFVTSNTQDVEMVEIESTSELGFHGESTVRRPFFSLSS